MILFSSTADFVFFYTGFFFYSWFFFHEYRKTLRPCVLSLGEGIILYGYYIEPPDGTLTIQIVSLVCKLKPEQEGPFLTFRLSFEVSS